MTDSPTGDISTGFRACVIELLETLWSRALQEEYRKDVPIADVSAELLCGWFDDLYHPTAPSFATSFSEAEIHALSSFHQRFESEVGSLPEDGGLQAFWTSPAWDRIGSAAKEVLQALEGDAPLPERGFTQEPSA